MRPVHGVLLNQADGYSSQNSTPARLTHLVGYSVTISSSGGASGTVKLQCSNDDGTDQNGSNVSHWVDITNSSQTYSGTDLVYNVIDAYYKWFRVVYTPDGSATAGSKITATWNGKGTS